MRYKLHETTLSCRRTPSKPATSGGSARWCPGLAGNVKERMFYAHMCEEDSNGTDWKVDKGKGS